MTPNARRNVVVKLDRSANPASSTIIIADIYDEAWLLEIEAIAAR